MIINNIKRFALVICLALCLTILGRVGKLLLRKDVRGVAVARADYGPQIGIVDVGHELVVMNQPGLVGITSPVLSHDGAALAFGARSAPFFESHHLDLYIASIGNDRAGLLVPRRLTSNSEGTYVTGASWSPNGQWLAYVQLQSDLSWLHSDPYERLPLGSSPKEAEVLLYNVHDARTRHGLRSRLSCWWPLQWSPDSRYLAVPTEDDLTIVDVKGNYVSHVARSGKVSQPVGWMNSTALIFYEPGEGILAYDLLRRESLFMLEEKAPVNCAYLSRTSQILYYSQSIRDSVSVVTAISCGDEWNPLWRQTIVGRVYRLVYDGERAAVAFAETESDVFLTTDTTVTATSADAVLSLFDWSDESSTEYQAYTAWEAIEWLWIMERTVEHFH